MKKIILPVLLTSIAFASCKKDEKVCDLNATNLAGSYKVTSFIYKADATTPAVDLYATADACEKDDLIIFNVNNTITFSDLGVVCSPSGNDTGTWSLSGNSLNFDGVVYSITTFSCSGMTATSTGPAVGETETITLVKQ